MCITTQHYYKCGCKNGAPTYEVCDLAFEDMEKAKTKNQITYDLSFEYPHCEKKRGEPYRSPSRICIDCKRQSGDGNKVPVISGKRETRWALENGTGWTLRK